MSKEKTETIFAGITSSFLLFVGILGAILAGFGTCAVCTITVLAFILSIFGLSIGFLIDYNIYFIIFGVLMLALTAHLIYNKHKYKCKDGSCEVHYKKKR